MPDWSNPEVRKRALGLRPQGFGTLEGARTDSSSNTAAGVEIHNAATTGRNGQTIPADSVEIYGKNLVFSEVGNGSVDDVDFAASNLSASTTTADIGATVTISVDITNNGVDQGTQIVGLKEDGNIVASQVVTVGASATKSITFSRAYTEFIAVDVQVLNSNVVTIKPEGLGI